MENDLKKTKERILLQISSPDWKEKHLDNSDSDEIPVETPEYIADEMEQKSARARLIAKVYGEDPLICPDVILK